MQAVLKWLGPAGFDAAGAGEHTGDGAYRRAVAVGVESRFDCEADRGADIALAAEKRHGDDHGVGGRQAPVVVAAFIVRFVDFFRNLCG